jgi:sugar phosphate isomerase/epimerase
MSDSRPKLGIQLYTVREDCQRDLGGTIRELAKMGYEGIEGGIYTGDDLKTVQDAMAETGILYAGGMTSMAEFESSLDEIESSIKSLGCTDVLCPWINQEEREDLEAWKKIAARKQKIGEECRARGLRYMYHLHGFEFSDLGGGTRGIDVLLNETDDAVGFEIDIYWVFHAGADPVALYRQMLDRTPFLHLKDMIKNPDPTDVEVGEGIVPVKEIVDIAMANGCDWMLVEQEMFDKPPIEASRISLANVKAMMGI